MISQAAFKNISKSGPASPKSEKNEVLLSTPKPYSCPKNDHNDHRKAKSIEDSMDFATKRQVWLRMILRIIRPMLIAMRIGQKSTALLLSSFVYTKLLGATLFSVAPSDRHYDSTGSGPCQNARSGQGCGAEKETARSQTGPSICR